MLYPITRPLAKITLSLFFRELYFSHAERIPKDKAVILAANHPTAFLEPCILACWLDTPIYFMVRGDIFSKKWANWILRDLHMIPVYRKKDGGLKQVRQNHQSLDEATAVLCRKKPLLVMAEGGTNGDRQLKPIQKGVARLALKTQSEFPDLAVQVVPVGVNYSKVDGFREIALFDFGEAMPVETYLEAYKDNPNLGIRMLTDDLATALRGLVIQVDKPERSKLTETFLEMAKNSRPYRFRLFYQRTDQILEADRVLSRHLGERSPSDFEALETAMEQYQVLLEENQVGDLGLGQVGKIGFPTLLKLLLLALPAFAGLLLHLLPGYLAFRIAQRRVRRKEYWSSIVAGTGMLFFFLYYVLLLVLALLFLGLKGLLAWLLVPLCGLAGIWWYEASRRWLAVRRVFQLPQQVRSILLEDRRQLFRQVNN